MIGLVDMIRPALPAQSESEAAGMPQPAAEGTGTENFLSVLCGALMAPAPLPPVPPTSGGDAEPVTVQPSSQLGVGIQQASQTQSGVPFAFLPTEHATDLQLPSSWGEEVTIHRSLTKREEVSSPQNAISSSVTPDNTISAAESRNTRVAEKSPSSPTGQSENAPKHEPAKPVHIPLPNLIIERSSDAPISNAAPLPAAPQELQAIVDRFAPVIMKENVEGEGEKRPAAVLNATSLSQQTSIADNRATVVAVAEKSTQPEGQKNSDATSQQQGRGVLPNAESTPSAVQDASPFVEADVEQTATHLPAMSQANDAEPAKPAIVEHSKPITVQAGNTHSTINSSSAPKAEHLVASHTFPRIPDEFARNLIIKISDELKLHLSGQMSEIKVRLKPEVLGELTLKMALVENGVTAVLDVSQPQVKTALEAQIPQMREALSQQGIDVKKFEILSGGDMQHRQPGEGNGSKRQRRFQSEEDVDGAGQQDAVKRFGYNTVEYII